MVGLKRQRATEEEKKKETKKEKKKMALYESSDYFLMGWRNAALEIKEGLCLRQNVSLVK